MTNDVTQLTVDASPTKAFFVEMLTRDVRMVMAILDLIDNCIDGALRQRGNDSLLGLEVRIEYGPDSFTIADNCGGIPLDLALNHAFRFGKLADTPRVEHSVGRFGVGMKRALFKLGRNFSVDTNTDKEAYTIAVDVNQWLTVPDWTFSVTKMAPIDLVKSRDVTGTIIAVTNLTEEAKSWVKVAYNETSLKTEISRRHQHHIDRGIAISLNGVTIPTSRLQFLVSESPALRPAYRAYARGGVNVRLLAGVGKSSPLEAGWYVYCNGRMVLDADRSRTTGWGEPDMVPRFHNQYARFRGAALFDSSDSTLLPWTTTKDSVDEGVLVFSKAYGIMVTLMRPVIRFLHAVDRDNDRPEGARKLMELLDKTAKPVSMVDLRQSESFTYEPPPPLPPPAQRLVSIQFQKPRGLVNAVMKSIGAGSARAAGEMAFDYYVEQEDVDAR